jgi:hypothetical protein
MGELLWKWLYSGEKEPKKDHSTSDIDEKGPQWKIACSVLGIGKCHLLVLEVCTRLMYIAESANLEILALAAAVDESAIQDVIPFYIECAGVH